MPSRTGARLLVDQLLIQGVNHAFTVPGESFLPVLDALYDSRDMIKLIVNRHESGATFMAEAYAKLTGQPGVAFVTRGPGATNAAIGVHVAHQDSSPLILFIGQVGNDFVEREAFQEIDYRRMFGQMTKWVAQIDRADRVPEFVARAFQVATSGRAGPVVLALPEDMLSTKADVGDALCHQPVLGAPSDTQIAALRRLLGRAQRPIVILGGFGWTPAACDNFKRFAEANYLPVACAFRYQDLFDNRHPELHRRRRRRRQSKAGTAHQGCRPDSCDRAAAGRDDDLGLHVARCTGAGADADSCARGCRGTRARVSSAVDDQLRACRNSHRAWR